MEYIEEEVLFKEFQSKWGEQLRKLIPIIKYMSTYPELTDKLWGLSGLGIEKINSNQSSWLGFINQSTSKEEKAFLKDYWFPINLQYKYFIDFSTDAFPMINLVMEAKGGKRGWGIKSVFENLSEFLLELDSPDFDIEKYFKEPEDEDEIEIDDNPF